LHPKSIDDPDEIRSLLERARLSGAVLHRGLNQNIDLERAVLEAIEDECLVLRAENFDRTKEGQVFLNFSLEDRPYFFATIRADRFQGNRYVVRIPTTIFYTERRDRSRRRPDREIGDPWRVEVVNDAGDVNEALVEDVSPGGLGIVVHCGPYGDRLEKVRVRFLDGLEAGTEARLELRNQQPVDGRSGWIRVGLVRSESEAVQPIEVEHRSSIFDACSSATRPGHESCVASAVTPGDRRDVRDPHDCDSSHVDPAAMGPVVQRISNARGEEIVGLLDSTGTRLGAPAVIMPNGWGRTKEALLPLARTIVSTFRAQGESVNVLRFDGVRKRGESHGDPECRIPGRENHNFVFSQGVEDIEVVARYLRQSPDYRASSVVVISFSAAAIEVRKAIARDDSGLFDGWVSVVGSPDLQSMARSISGGVDFVGGADLGLRFGLQELLGVTVDIDRIAVDARENQMSFIEDSRCDMASIDVPITWYHGEYDAWVDLGRVRDVLSHGDQRERHLVVIPAGHQLKSSHEAGETFECIARDVARMTLGRELPSLPPSRDEVRRLRLAELKRLPRHDPDLQSFWRDYLIGRDSSLGIELLTSSCAYRAMMDMQLDALQLRENQRVADLGAGTGSFALQLAARADRPAGLRVSAIDFVSEALGRARSRLVQHGCGAELPIDFLAADLNLVHRQQTIPLASASFDRAIASLLISYLERPELFLEEVFRILRPGGRLVVSSLCRDADISRLYVECFAEHQIGWTERDLPELREAELGTLARNFLNDAARILELEELGAFCFWDPGELAELVAKAGFVEIVTSSALGVPPQAVVVSAAKPPA
jgi:ubiquinone/menaquinone biosynthesis C-methylase UbiE/pimeloyl-ACP methyl ester carboxylesterase